MKMAPNIRREARRALFLTILPYSLSVLFIYAATLKAMDYNVFVADIAKSPLLTKISNTTLAPLLLGVEFLTAVLLPFRATMKTGLYLSSFLMLTFTLYLSTLYFFFTKIPCSCGGILGMMPYPVHIAFNLLFTILSFTGVFLITGSKEDLLPGKTA
jgi:hypothetical protein